MHDPFNEYHLRGRKHGRIGQQLWDKFEDRFGKFIEGKEIHELREKKQIGHTNDSV
jgi:hypothetical protein